ncbi:hypothetical protein, partial [Phenylobacterium sp.]|uniref:hypothetical protein n=1 Tax=Phenylobacterium sp. TaxID=1871053 RepID=UPI002736DE9A
PAAEGGYLIQALYGKTLPSHPELLADVQGLNNTAFFLIIRATTYATQDLLAWMRVLGACAYFAGVMLVWRSARDEAGQSPPLGFLLLALAFPYYRFAFAVLPDGWYVAVLGAIILLTARVYLSRPIVHAIVAGALGAVLALLKPQGASVVLAVLILALLDGFLGRRDIRVLIGRVVVFATVFLTAGNLVLLAAGQPVLSPFASMFNARQAAVLDVGMTAETLTGAVRALAPLLSSFLLLAGIPALAGLLRIEMRWRWIVERKLGPFRLERQEIAFLLVLLSLIAALGMTAIFEPAETGRIAGREFELFTPLLWLTSAPFIAELDRAGARWWRIAMGLVVAVGLAGLMICLAGGATTPPWETAALSAFAWGGPSTVPHFALACAVVLAAAVAMGFTAWPTQRIWLGCFVALAVLSTLVDIGWESSGRPARAALAADLRQADKIAGQRLGGVAVIAGDKGTAHQLFLGLRGRPQTVLIGPDAERPAGRLADIDTVVAAGAKPPINTWRPIFEGRSLKVFERASPPHLHVTDGEPLGSSAVSG